jgi:hypothetical protein
MLKRLGIDVWVPRAVPSAADGRAAADDSSAAAASTSAAAGPAGAMVREPATAEAPERRAPSTRTPPAPAAPATASPTAAAPTRDDELPACRILGLRLPGAVLLCEADEPALARRLGRDLLASSAGASVLPPEETVFDWDPEAVGSSAVSGRRALAAFVRRQLDELGAGVLLVSAPVMSRLPDLEGEVGAAVRLVRIPGLQTLLDQPEAKQALWQRIQSLAD